MNITILTVDTDYTRTLLNSKLEEQNYTVLAGTNNYEEALKLYKECLPDIIILDIDLGNTNKGLNFITELLKVDPSAQVIALSTLFQNSTRAKLLKQGIDRLVMKPYQPAHIWQEIDNICENNDIDSLRNTREKLVNESSLSGEDQSIGAQLNNQILSLRDQISKSRNRQENNDNELTRESATLNKYKNSVYTSDDFSFNKNSNINDFVLDFDNTEEINTEYNPYSLELSLDNYQTNRSDNSQDLNISLYDTQEEETIYTSDHSTLYRDFSNKNNETQINKDNLNSYLGLPVFIDRENGLDPSEDSIEDYSTPRSSTNGANYNSLFQKLLKKKGGK